MSTQQPSFAFTPCAATSVSGRVLLPAAAQVTALSLLGLLARLLRVPRA